MKDKAVLFLKKNEWVCLLQVFIFTPFIFVTEKLQLSLNFFICFLFPLQSNKKRPGRFCFVRIAFYGLRSLLYTFLGLGLGIAHCSVLVLSRCT